MRSDSVTTIQKEKEMHLHIDGPGSVTCVCLSLSPLKNTSVSSKIKISSNFVIE